MNYVKILALLYKIIKEILKASELSQREYT